MDLRERKLIINGATEKLPEYAEGKWLHGVSAKDASGMVTTGINFAGSVANSFGPVKSEGDILQESGTSVGQGSGFSYLKLNSIDVGAQMDELSKLNTANTLNTAASGAALGSAFGPIGAGIGGVVGGAVGFIGGLFRKNKMAERIRQALIQATRNNNFNLASAQTDYLTNQYNVEHDNTQDDMLYAAKDGHKPVLHVYSASGYANGKPNALGSHHEWLIDTFTGEETQLPGKPDKKDTIKLKLKHPGATAIVSNNKFLDGIRNSDYYTLTKDLNGALARDQWYRDMKDYRTVKLLGYGSFNAKNGILPGFKYGKKDVLNDFNTAMNDASAFADQMREARTSSVTTNPLGLMKEYENYSHRTGYKDIIAPMEFAPMGNKNLTPADQSSYDQKRDPYLNPTRGTGDNSNWANAITSGMGILGGLSQILQAKNEPLNKPDTYAPNQYERQALDIYGWLNPATNRAVQAAAATEARNRYNINRMGGLSGAQKYLAAVLSGIGLQNNIASIIADANRERNQYRSQLAGAMMNAGASDAQRRQNANQYLEEAYARSHGARTQMEQMGMQNILAAFNQYYKNLEKNNRFMRTMAYYDQDYDLRRRDLERGWHK